MSDPGFEDLNDQSYQSMDSVIPIRSVRHFPSLDSTNSWASANSSQFRDEQLPLLVICESQTAGRGRSGRHWHADSGTLTFSILDSPQRMGIAPADTPKLGLLAGLAVAEAVESCIPLCSARIKWPNDVLVAGKKIAGILVENSISQNSIGRNSNGQPFGRIVIGIGVNVATKFDRAEDEIRKRAGSLIELGQRFVTRRQVLDATLERFFTNLGPLHQTTGESADDEHLQNESQHRTSTPAFALAMAAIRRRCFLTGHFITMNHGGEQISGCCEGIDDSGAIVIESEKGRRVLQSGEVVRVQIRKD